MFRRHFIKLLSMLPFVGPAMERRRQWVGPEFEPSHNGEFRWSGPHPVVSLPEKIPAATYHSGWTHYHGSANGTTVYRCPPGADPLNPDSWVEVERY